MGRATRVLCGGIYYGDGPRWRDGRLWFSDFFAHAVYSVSLAGDLRTEVKIDDQASGLGWMPDGSLLVVSMTKRQVLRRSLEGKIAVHADLSHIAGGPCNDMVVDSKGRAYVGNFGYDLYADKRSAQAIIADHPTAKLACVTPDGSAQVAAEDIDIPNGTVITPDGKTLIIGETFGGRLTAFDIGADGSLGNRRVWAATSPRMPDGIALDAKGRVWMAHPFAPECVLYAEGGDVVEVIDTGMPCFACMLGGDDGRSLFMLTAPTYHKDEASASPKGKLLVAKVDIPHAGLP